MGFENGSSSSGAAEVFGGILKGSQRYQNDEKRVD